MTYELNCIKCGVKYQSEEDDPYYCAPCLEDKKKLAAELDAKRAKEGKAERNPYNSLSVDERFPSIFNTYRK